MDRIAYFTHYLHRSLYGTLELYLISHVRLICFLLFFLYVICTFQFPSVCRQKSLASDYTLALTYRIVYSYTIHVRHTCAYSDNGVQLINGYWILFRPLRNWFTVLLERIRRHSRVSLFLSLSLSLCVCLSVSVCQVRARIYSVRFCRSQAVRHTCSIDIRDS